jgi:hypothetical protein
MSTQPASTETATGAVIDDSEFRYGNNDTVTARNAAGETLGWTSGIPTNSRKQAAVVGPVID